MVVSKLSQIPAFKSNRVPFLVYFQNHTPKSEEASASVPRLKHKPQMWHRDIQVYVAAFQYLLKKETPFWKGVNNGTTAIERLGNISISAKEVLCEIEQLINMTTGNLREPRTRDEITKLWKFHVPSAVEAQPHTLDREFTIHKFSVYVTDLKRVLTRRRKRLQNQDANPDSNSTANSNTHLEHRNRRGQRHRNRSGSVERRRNNQSGQRVVDSNQSAGRRRKNHSGQRVVDNNLSAGRRRENQSGQRVVDPNSSAGRAAHKNRHRNRKGRKHRNTTTPTPTSL